MTDVLSLETYLGASELAVERMLRQARDAGPGDPVPTCPGWTMRDLIAHQGMVFTWARETLHAGGGLGDPGDAEIQGRSAEDQESWLRGRYDALAADLRALPDDHQAFVFLKDSPPPRIFWARRQAHEATIHAVDALAARLDRVPEPAELTISTELAADGIDEVLTGFVPRRSGALRSAEPLTVNVIPTDHAARWSLLISDQPVQTSRHTSDQAQVTLQGTAAELYVGLWNRGSLPASDPAFVDQWRTQMAVNFG